MDGSENGSEENRDESLSILVKNEPPAAEVIREEIIQDELDISNDLEFFSFPPGEIIPCKGYGEKNLLWNCYKCAPKSVQAIKKQKEGLEPILQSKKGNLKG